MLKQLEEESTIETATVSAHPPHLLVTLVEHIKAILELVLLVLFLQVDKVDQLGNVWHTLSDLTADFLSVGSISMILVNSLINDFLCRS